MLLLLDYSVRLSDSVASRIKQRVEMNLVVEELTLDICLVQGPNKEVVDTI